jgi:hypothetical protein
MEAPVRERKPHGTEHSINNGERREGLVGWADDISP